MISRDRALDYARGATDGAPQAIQVVDRFHLLCNLREAVERALLRLRPALRIHLVADSVLPTVSPLPPEEVLPPPRYARSPALQRLQSVRQAERLRRYQDVKKRAAFGQSIRQIAQASGLATKTISRWLRTESLPPENRGYRARGKIDPYVPYLQARLAEGCTNQSRLWREIHERGFTGTRSLVGKWVRAHDDRRFLAPAAPTIELPSAKQLSWLLMHTEEERSEEEHEMWLRIQQHEGVTEIHELAQQFRTMFRERQPAQLDTWLAAGQASAMPELRNFALVLQREYAAVKAALTLPWSQGPVEGHIHRVKLIKRSGYGRANFDLLRKRVLHAV